MIFIKSEVVWNSTWLKKTQRILYLCKPSDKTCVFSDKIHLVFMAVCAWGLRTRTGCKFPECTRGWTTEPYYVIYLFTKVKLETVDHEVLRGKECTGGELCRREQRSEALLRRELFTVNLLQYLHRSAGFFTLTPLEKVKFSQWTLSYLCSRAHVNNDVTWDLWLALETHFQIV